MPKFAVILTAAGRSTRFGDSGKNKVYEEIDGRAIWLRAAKRSVTPASDPPAWGRAILLTGASWRRRPPRQRAAASRLGV